MWLDAEFNGGRGRNSRGKTLPTAIKEAEKMLDAVDEGQVGIYGAYAIGPCHGYVIKQDGRVRFDPWKDF